MKKFEYTIVRGDIDEDDEENNEDNWLNGYAEQGWEMVSFQERDGKDGRVYFVAAFKREKI